MIDKRINDWMSEFFLLAVLCLLGGFVGALLNDGTIPQEPEQELREAVDHPTIWGDPRSSQWPTVRRQFVSSNPECAACGSTETLNVHHIEPFHLNPERELDPSNLITLCREHHFRVGHDPDGPWEPKRPSWMESNPRVREHCKKIRESVR